MIARVVFRVIAAALAVGLATSVAVGYIHFPPMTLPKMCQKATNIRVLSVKKYDKAKGVVVFQVAETIKGQNPKITTFRHAVRPDADGVKPILDWLADQKQAVMFSIEADPRGTPLACGYVFIDNYCYSVDYNSGGAYWLLIRAEPNLSACYHGPVEQLRKLTKDILAGREVKVPVKEPASPESKEAQQRRIKEVTDILTKNRSK